MKTINDPNSSTMKLLESIRFIQCFDSNATIRLEESLNNFANTLDHLSMQVYDLIKENRNIFTPEERFKAGEYANQLLESKDLIISFSKEIKDFVPLPNQKRIISNGVKEEKESSPLSYSDHKSESVIPLILNEIEEDEADKILSKELDKLLLEDKEESSVVSSGKTISLLGNYSTLWDCDTDSVPTGFELEEVYYPVFSWSELFEKTCQIFYQKNDLKMRSYIGKSAYGNGSINHSYFVVYPNSKRNYFVFESFKHGKLYIEKETNAIKIRTLLLKVLNDYGIKSTNFYISYES